MPQRIQLKRSKGWKMPANTVKVDRTTKWGNPFVPGKPAPFGPTKGQIVADKRHAFVLYRSLAPLNEKLVAEARAELAGKNLACWCPHDDPYEDACHAAVLLQLANESVPKMKLTHCTLTGVDAQTDLAGIKSLSTEFPFVEWGFLYSPKRQGMPGRYPSVAMLQNAFLHLPPDVRVALHVCGQGVPDLLRNGEQVIEELVELVAARGGRVQLNFNLLDGRVTQTDLTKFLKRFPNLTVITQHNAANASLATLMWQASNHAVLFDESGGRGQLPGGWKVPMPGVACGYAGGLGPDNLGEQLDLISAAAGDCDFWIDMEGKLRTLDETKCDWFDLEKARRCLEAVKAGIVA